MGEAVASTIGSLIVGAVFGIIWFAYQYWKENKDK
ncbi:Uncharacterised protein [Psychrobacter phenylpyruvicus]|uniref:Uncharacterized protein n=1 Tax=Psychrobacter phenylpyruvicus TaxID=29432 RepID=A0A379LQG5_9GAMM|nr:Uncharacterised protein [Psychrobacter phenylpyruvicus]